VTEHSSQCPKCAHGGVAVDRITLKALLTPDGLRRGVPAQPRYCATSDCPIVYFDGDGDVTFTEADLIVRVYAKHAGDPDVLACYCFGVNVGAMRNPEHAQQIREMVAKEVQAGHCACEVKNPKGACCLGDLVRVERGSEHSAAKTDCCAVS
jgi:Zinc binding domain